MSRPWPAVGGLFGLPKAARHFHPKPDFFLIVGSPVMLQMVIFPGSSLCRLGGWRCKAILGRLFFHKAKGVAFVNVGVELSELFTIMQSYHP